MDNAIRTLAERLLRTGFDGLSERECRVIAQIAHRAHISRDLSLPTRSATRGERIADRVALFGGSWTFIILFGIWLVLWTLGNSILLPAVGVAFDPYPYIFLNLVLSMLAAIQAPVILMSQNRQAMRDREAAAHDYEVNLKAELEIMELHDKLDQMRHQQLGALVERQEEQIRLLTALLAGRQAGG